ncbi:MAG: ParB/RepB/Spo0J family partition protein [Pseudomonadota bacterium]|nr:ParB/RepB/Spo0J family partition protein [Pseudomonadota bacterium]MEE3182304.1 ParB/RepB/Spo0J family partition protein [Pseudomonadota bacterium]
MAKKRGLGRGLDALLNASVDDQMQVGAESDSKETLSHVGVDQIHRGQFQPRKHIDEASIEELSQSIKAQGVMQPIVLRRRPAGGYEIIAGERRWRASVKAGLLEIPAVVREVTDQQALALALIENLQREDLNPLEEARALGRLRDEFGLTQQEVADAVGKSRTAVTNLLRLQNLGPRAAQLLEDGAIEMGHARALLPLEQGDQDVAARHIASKRLSVRQAEALVRRMLAGPKETTRRVDADTRSLERELSEKLGAPVVIRHRSSRKGGGRGQILIQYGSVEELDGILRHFRR